MIRKMQIFISSTYTDMLEERQATVQAVLNADHIPAGMELFKAGNESQLQTIYRWIDECDLYLLILGGRYGSIEAHSMKSYIELEYEYALNHNIPVFAVILSDSYLHSKAAKCSYEVFETNEIEKYKKFKQKVKTKIVNEVNTIDEMKLAITNSLHEFEKSEKIKGWIKYSDNVITTQFERLSKNKKEEMRKNLAYNLIGMNTSSIDFYNSVDKRVFDLACNSPYIDKFKRIIEILICDDNEKAIINMENYFKFVNLNGCKNFYRSSPVFPRLREAQSYKHLKFEINNIDCLSKISSNIQVSEKNNQFKYIVKNEYPINEMDTFDGCTIFHKIQYKVYLQNFYQYHALIFPCRDYTLEIVLKNHQNKYYLALATNEFFDVNNYVERTQYRDKHICNINYLDWLLPGSGYSFTIQKIYEEVQDQNLENE